MSGLTFVSRQRDLLAQWWTNHARERYGSGQPRGKRTHGCLMLEDCGGEKVDNGGGGGEGWMGKGRGGVRLETGGEPERDGNENE